MADFLADLVTSMAIADVSAQMRRRIVERELGYYRGALRRKVSVHRVCWCDAHNPIFFPLSCWPAIFPRTFRETFRDSARL